jgi:hypothetical protein
MADLSGGGGDAVLGSAYAPNINAYLQEGNQAASYYATGNPSEPNYTALGGADDFGITDDSQWNCDATGANAPKDLPLPTNTDPGLASSPFASNPPELWVRGMSRAGDAQLHPGSIFESTICQATGAAVRLGLVADESLACPQVTTRLRGVGRDFVAVGRRAAFFAGST